MEDVSKAVEKYRKENPNANFQEAKKFIESITNDKEDIKSFISLWNKLHLEQKEFSDDVDRIWPERKYG